MNFNKLILVSFILVFVSTSYAEDMAELERMVSEISDTTMSPYCPGRTLSACPSPAARELRDKVTDWVEEGYSVTAVKNKLFTIYGEKVLGAPRAEGFGFLAWLTPFLFVSFGTIVILLFFKKLRRVEQDMGSDSIDSNQELDQNLLQKIENEVKQRVKD